MCYSIYLSTDSDQVLSAHPSELFLFRRPNDEEAREVRALLAYPNIWYLSSRYGGCSCHYRHLLYESASLGFGEPVEWFSEDLDDIESTEAVHDLFSEFVVRGVKIDLVDLWGNEAVDEFEQITVSLHSVPRNAFRFFEGYRFELVP